MIYYQGKEWTLKELSRETRIGFHRLNWHLRKYPEKEVTEIINSLKFTRKKRKSKHIVSWEGRDWTLRELEDATGIPYYRLRQHLIQRPEGRDPADIIEDLKSRWKIAPTKHKISWRGKDWTINALSKASGVAYSTLYAALIIRGEKAEIYLGQ